MKRLSTVAHHHKVFSDFSAYEPYYTDYAIIVIIITFNSSILFSLAALYPLFLENFLLVKTNKNAKKIRNINIPVSAIKR